MRKLPFVAAVIVSLSMAEPAAAHPHAWIDVDVDVQFDAEGRVTALKERWLFDEFYTADTVQKGERDKMDRLVTRILGNLREYGYFTVVTVDGRSIPLSAPIDHSAHMEGHRLSMSFTVPLSQPVAAPLTYSVFDPFYFIEMLHAERTDSIRLRNGPPGCRSRLIPAKPDPKRVAAAAAIDRTGNGGNNLGAQFAEKVEIRCDTRR
jgi:ABC-type uncharacterized transport system substrate-binding protein